ncbi:MAG: hypothetical protein Q9217_003590 [Psora testacea]
MMAAEVDQGQAPTLGKPLIDDSQQFDDGWTSLVMDDDVHLLDSIAERTHEETLIQELENKPADEKRAVATEEAPPETQKEGSRHVATKLFTRPSSSHNDIASGFSYSKAKPAPKFDFSRAPKEATSTTAKRDVTPPSAQTQHHDSSPQFEAAKPPEPCQDIPIAVPFPNALVVVGTAKDNSSGIPSADATTRPVTTTICQTADTSMSADDTLITGDPGIALQQQQRPGAQCHESITRHDQASAQAGNAKNRRKKRPTAFAQQRSGVKSFMAQASPDDLYEMQRFREYKMEQQRFEALHLLEHKTREVDELDQKLYEFAAEHQRLQQELGEKKAALAQFQAFKTTWDSRVSKLSDSVKGLCNDHNRLRDSARNIKDQHDHVRSDEVSIRESLTAIKQSHDADIARSQQLIAKYQHQCEGLNETVQTLRGDIEATQGNLALERNRNECLETELAKISAGYERLRNEYASNCEELNTKLNVLIDKPQQAAVLNEAHAQQTSTSMLGECLALIQELVGRKNVEPEELQNLGKSMGGYTDSVKQSMLAYEKTSSEAVTAQQKFATSLQGELQTVYAEVKTGKMLQEQVAEQREAKAIVRERLEAMCIELTKAKCELATLQTKDEGQRRKILELEAKVARSKEEPTDTSASILRIQSLESANKDLESQTLVAQKEVEDLLQQLHQQSDEAAQLKIQLNGFQLQLEDATAAQEKLRNERVEYETNVAIQRAHDKKALSEAADSAMARLQGEFENQKQQLIHKHEEAAKEIKRLAAREQYSLIDYGNNKEQAAKAEKALNEKMMEKDKEVKIAQGLREMVTGLEARLNVRDQQQLNLQSQVSRLQEDLEGSNMQKNDLQAKLNRAQQENETRKVRQAAQLQDSNATPVLQTDSRVQSARSRHFSQPPAEVEDSSLRDSHPLTALQGIMNDPFSSAHHEEQQLETGDFASLFPSTPDGRDVQEERSHMFTSQTETRVVSRRSHTMQPGSGDRQEREVGPSWQNSQARKDGFTSHRAAQDIPAMMTARAPSNAYSAHGGHKSNQQSEKARLTSRSSAPRSNAQALPKRDAATAGFTKPNSAAKKSRRQDSKLQQLGPVIGESQSPSHPRLLGGRGRKMSSKAGKKTWHGEVLGLIRRTALTQALDNRMNARFQQELDAK